MPAITLNGSYNDEEEEEKNNDDDEFCLQSAIIITLYDEEDNDDNSALYKLQCMAPLLGCCAIQPCPTHFIFSSFCFFLMMKVIVLMMMIILGDVNHFVLVYNECWR